MQSSLECLECVVRQALRAARMATDDPELQRKIVNTAAAQIPGMDLRQSPAVISLVAYQEAAAISAVADPYVEAKRTQNAQALALEDDLRALVRESKDPLETALHLSATGNVIDLGIQNAEDIDMRAAIDQVMHERFAVDHTEAFRASLASCKDLLFLLDNAGEIVFDKVLIEELQRHTKVTAVVKAGPVINDATMADAEQVGLTQVCEVIDNGGAFVGSPLALIPPHFRARMDAADIILGKGQGNYETVDDYPGDVFLMLKAKCEIVARHMGVQLGQLGLISTRQRARSL